MNDHSEQSEHDKAKATADASRYLAFTLNEEAYAIPLLKVKEVIALTDITPVPHTPSHFVGIMNLRGQIISIIDLRRKLKLKNTEIKSENAIVILDFTTLFLGVIVDSVESVLALDGDDIRPSPHIESSVDSGYIAGVSKKGKKLVLLLDIEKTLSVEDITAIQTNSNKNQAA